MLLDDIDDLLTTGGVATTIYRGFMADRPNDAVAIIETGGLPPIKGMADGPGEALFERATVQITRRSTSYDTARDSMHTIYTLLDGVTQRTINSTRYSMIAALQSPFGLGRDESGRTMLGCNFTCWKTLSTG